MDPDTILQEVRDLLPAIRARRQEIEQARRLPRDLVDSLRATGVFRLGVPRAVGGLEATPSDLMRAAETLSSADGSTGWCAMVAIGNNVAAGYMPEAGAREIFADPGAPSAAIAAPSGAATRVKDGLRVSGRWSFASGITHCDWVWAGCMVMENGKPYLTEQGPEIVHVGMPVSDLAIHDTWYVSGLCGSGSHDFSADGLFVPERRTFRLLDPSGHRSEPLYRMPPMGLFVYQVACVSLGIARGALDELAESAQSKVPSLYREVLAEKPVAQVELAHAEAALGGARSFLYQTVEEMWDTVRAGREPTGRQVALGRIAANHAAETGAAVALMANRLGGGSTIYSTASLQRHARDAEAVTHHFTVAPHVWEEAGRVLLGRKPNAAAF